MADPEEQVPSDGSFVLVAAAFTLSVFLLFRQFGRVDLALPICICLGGVLFAVRMRWDLRRRFWFWATLVLVLLLHVPLIIMVPFPRITVNRITLLPFGVADFLIFFGAVRLVERLIVKSPPADEEA